jgi:DNA-binding CsgD family transcriptional regulator
MITCTHHRNFLCPVTIGRIAEIAALRDFLASDGGVLLVSGEAGVGKSRLVREAHALAAASGIVVLEGRAFQEDRALPFAPARDLLRGLVDRLGARETAALAGSCAADLALLLPELAPGESPGQTHLDPDFAKQHLFDCFSRLLAGAAGTSPHMLVIEDLHWADDASLELLLQQARRTARAPRFLLLTYRSDEIRPALAHFLATLDRERLAAEIELDRLDVSQVAAMLQAILDAAEPVPAGLLHAIYSLTEGNPFFIEEVVTALSAKQRFLTEEGAWAECDWHLPQIPRSVYDAVRQRVAALSRPACDVLTLAAVTGRRFEFDLLAALLGYPEEALVELVKELVAAQLVVEEGCDRFAFRHALTREAVTAGLLDRERRRLHRRVADAIGSLSAVMPDSRIDDLSAHYFAAGAWEQALDAACRAGARALALHSPRAAAEHFTRAEMALRALALPPDPQIHRERGRAYETLGELDLARADFELALDLSRAAADRRAEWDILLELGLLWSSRDYRQTGEFANRALAVARQDGDPAMIARSLNRLGNWHVNLEQPAMATALHREALTLCEAATDRRGVAETLDLLGMVGLMGGDLRASCAAYTRAAELWQELDDRRGLAAALLGIGVQGPTFHTDTVPVARSAADVRDAGLRSVALCREIDWRVGESFALWGFVGMGLGACGDYALALPATHDALRIAREIGHRQWTVGAGCILGNLFADLGDFAAARDQLAAALALAREIGSPYWVRSAAGWLAAALVQAGELDAATLLLRAERDDATPLDTIAGRLLWCAEAELALTRGDPASSLAVVRRLQEATPGNPGRPVARLERLRGEALTAQGRYDEAETALLTARDEAAWSGARPHLLRTEIALCRLYRLQGRVENADAALARVRMLGDELAAGIPNEDLRVSFAAWLTTALPAARQRAEAAGARTAGPLTKRERDVAALLTEGLTNREIGERLYLSEWTVATHVRNILAKLDLSSRAQIAAWAAGQGLRANS